MDSIYLSSTGTQTEQLTSPILWHCLHVVKSSPEFKNLSYRITMDMNGNELLIVSRDQVTRVFGPPVEPISLTLDPSGKCLLHIPFRAVQHVPLTKTKTGHLELISLHALLQMVSGKGFCFCPGIPTSVLAGRACGKFVIMHRTPFKRFNAAGCPVYFKFPKFMDPNKVNQLPIRSLCPRCRQVTKWAQTLPVSKNIIIRPFTINPTPPNQVLYPIPVDNKRFLVKNSNMPVENVDKSPTKTAPSLEKQGMFSSAPLPLTVLEGSNVNYSSDAPKSGKNSPRCDSNTFHVSVVKKKGGLNSDKLQAVSDSLRQLLRQRSAIREGLSDGTAVDGGGQHKGEKSPASSRPRSPRSVKSKKNVCRICQKQFSSNLRLSKHVQRHEGNLPNLSQVLRKKIKRRKTSAAVLNGLLQRFSCNSLNVKRKNSVISEWHLQLMLNSLDDLLSNETNSREDSGRGKTSKAAPEKRRNKGKRKAEEPAAPHFAENTSIRPTVHRSGSGLAAVQTLLSAAQMADDDAKTHDLGKNINFNIQNGHLTEFPSTDNFSKRDADSPSHAKKARQSVRLASKRAGKKSKLGNKAAEAVEGTDLSLHEQTTSPGHHPSDEALTNLNLLSTVSLQAELRDSRGSPGLQLLSSASNLEKKMNKAHIPIGNEHRPFAKSPSSAPSLQTGVGKRTNIQHQIPTTVVPIEDVRASKKNAPPSMPPLILSTAGIVVNQSPHSSASSSPLISLTPATACALPILQQLQKNITNSHASATTSSGNHLPHEDVLGSNCGAMDLSKPKSFQSIAETSNSAKTPPTSKDSTDVLRHFMMIKPVSLPEKPQVAKPDPNHDPRIRLLSSKEADDSLQARMFASAKNYKVDPNKLIATGHIPTGVSSSQLHAPLVPGKLGKGKDKLNLPSQLNEKSEIQCGYKWSGSGGLVKERTQLVRELVPSVVMANILSGTVPTSGLPKMDDPISAPMQNVTKSRLPDKQQQQQESPLLAKSSQPPVPITGKNSPSAHHITLKPREAPVRPKTPQYVLNLSKNRNDPDTQPPIPASVQLHSKTGPVPFPTSVLKTSLLNTPSVLIPTSIYHKPPVQNSVQGSVIKKLGMTPSVMAPLGNTVLATVPNTILQTGQPAPTSTLATILRHPSKIVGSHSFSKTSNTSFSETISSTAGPINSTATPSNVVRLHAIKTEPFEIYGSGGKKSTVVPDGNTTLIKIEKPGSPSPSSSSERDLSTPPNLVVDMGLEKNPSSVSGNSTSGRTNNDAGNKPSAKGKVSIVNAPLKCEYCSQAFRTIRGHDYHTCPKKGR